MDTIVAADSDVTIGAADSATVTINDDDTAELTIAATDPVANESGDPGQFTLTLSSPADTDTIVAYTISGDASAGTDYATLSGFVTVIAGQTTATIDVLAVDDTILEDSESVTVTLDSIVSGDTDIGIGAANNATVTIEDNDSAQVNIVATDASASEPGDNGQFTVTLTATADSDTVVSYTVGGDASSGADFGSLTGSVTILAGQTSATIDLSVIDDSLLEDNEDVTVTLDSITSGDADLTIGPANAATVTIADDDTAEVTVVANDDTAAEPTDNGQFTVSISNASDTDTVVSYTLSGDATAGDDFANLSGTVTILAGQTSATIDVSVIDDSVLEDTETLTLTLDAITSGDAEVSIGTTDTATVTITDDDVAEISITANDDSAAEPTDNGQFTVSLSNPSDTDTTVTYTVAGDATAGDDFTPLSGTVTILAGQTTATIDVSVLDNGVLEATESLTVTLDSITAGNTDVTIGAVDSATVTIADDDTAEVTVIANDPGAGEPSDNGQFTVSLSAASDTDTVVSYSLSGDATAGTDYKALSGTVTIAAGSTTAVIDVNVIDDSILEATEALTLTLDAVTTGDSDITIGAADSATINFTDDDSAEVTIVSNDDSASEPSDGGQFTVSLSNPSDTDTVVTYTVAGDATSGDDFAPLSGSVTILAGQTSTTIDVNVLDDTLLEGTENVIVTLDSISSGDDDITIGATDSAIVFDR